MVNKEKPKVKAFWVKYSKLVKALVQQGTGQVMASSAAPHATGSLGTKEWRVTRPLGNSLSSWAYSYTCWEAL